MNATWRLAMALSMALSLCLAGCFTATERDTSVLQPLPETFSTNQPKETSIAAVPWWDTFQRDDLD